MKIFKAIMAPALLILLPAIGNVSIYKAPHLWIIFAIGVLGSLLQPDYHVVNDSHNSNDKGTEVQIIWSVFITQLLAVIEASYQRYPASISWNGLTTVTLLISVSGLLLRTWSIHTLGSNFTMHLAIQKKHQFITSGPYKYFRHPSYVGAFLTYTGTIILLGSWYSLVLAMILLPIAWFRRIYYEEQILTDKFGFAYISYCKSVKRAIPGIW